MYYTTHIVVHACCMGQLDSHDFYILNSTVLEINIINPQML